MALLVLMMLAVGRIAFPGLTDDSPDKVMMLRTHMTIGLTLLVLVILRFIVRLTTPKPAPADAGNPILNKIGVITHYVLYLFILGMGISGLGIAVQAGLLPMLSGKDAFLPEDLMVYPPYIGHGLTSWLLIGLIALHVGAALFHQIIRKDNLMARMWFGRK
jgi:cytochrome b561